MRNWVASRLSGKQLFGHPVGLFALFFTEMWERFSYYGMRALLLFYMAKGFLGYSDTDAYAVYGAYTALVYMTPFFGGLLADRLLGQRRAVIFGGVINQQRSRGTERRQKNEDLRSRSRRDKDGSSHQHSDRCQPKSQVPIIAFANVATQQGSNRRSQVHTHVEDREAAVASRVAMTIE